MTRTAASCVLVVMNTMTACIANDLAKINDRSKDPKTPVSLAIEIDNGVAKPLQVRRGQTFYLNQIDLRASTTSTVDEGVSGLRTRSDFATLPWSGISREEQEFVLLANADGTFTRRAFFRGATWMDLRSTFRLEQMDTSGKPLGQSITVDAGFSSKSHPSDDFFVRRLRAIQWTRDCRTTRDCAGAKNFEEEALVELRNAMHADQPFTIEPRATAFRLHWSMRPGRPYTVPLTQVGSPEFSYGFLIEVDTVTPPRPDGSYAPGSDITFHITLKDGAGKRLHPPGTLPSYNEIISGPNAAGIQYYRAFFDATTTYWRRKHRERMLMAEFIGPAQKLQPIRSIIDLDKFLNADDVQITGTFAKDRVHAEFHTFPTAHDLFGGAFDPAHGSWAKPVSDTWSHHIPENAPSGTYYLNVKGRRTYLGEDVPFSRTSKSKSVHPRPHRQQPPPGIALTVIRVPHRSAKLTMQMQTWQPAPGATCLWDSSWKGRSTFVPISFIRGLIASTRLLTGVPPVI